MNEKRAGRKAAMLLKHSLPSSSKELKVHMKRIERVAESIHRRYGVNARKWQVKHLRWFLEVDIKDMSDKTKYNYYLTILKAIEVLGKVENFQAFLLGYWCRPDGTKAKIKKTGRPRKVCFSSAN